MQIDWFTTVAQAVNFLVLLVILKFVLFDRIVASIDERRETIRSEQERVQSDRSQAETERKQAESIRVELEEARESLLHEAKSAAEEHSRELEQEVRNEADRMRDRFRASLRDQERQLISELVQTAAVGVSAAAERALEDLADAEIGARMVGHFCHRLRHATPEERLALREIWGQLKEPLVVRSNRELSEQEQKRVRDALRVAISDEHDEAVQVTLTYETSDDLASGIEVSGAGHSVGWSIHAYLSQIEERIQSALAEEVERESEEAQEEETRAESSHLADETEIEERAQQTGS